MFPLVLDPSVSQRAEAALSKAAAQGGGPAVVGAAADAALDEFMAALGASNQHLELLALRVSPRALLLHRFVFMC